MADQSYTAVAALDGSIVSTLVRRDDGVFVLTESAEPNADTTAYQAWIAAGNEPGAAVPTPPPPREQLGTVFLGAVADLGWWGWMDQGAAAQVAAGKPLDGRYWQAIGKADIVLVSDAKLSRVAKAAEAARVAASGQPAPASPLITMAAVMDHGDAMTTT